MHPAAAANSPLRRGAHRMLGSDGKRLVDRKVGRHGSTLGRGAPAFPRGIPASEHIEA